MRNFLPLPPTHDQPKSGVFGEIEFQSFNSVFQIDLAAIFSFCTAKMSILPCEPRMREKKPFKTAQKVKIRRNSVFKPFKILLKIRRNLLFHKKRTPPPLRVEKKWSAQTFESAGSACEILRRMDRYQGPYVDPDQRYFKLMRLICIIRTFEVQ